MNDDNNIWPDFELYTPSQSPASLLREAAAALAAKTDNLVGASVIRLEGQREGLFAYYMNIYSPALGNYKFRILTIEHELQMYPVTIYPDDAIGIELGYGLQDNWRRYVSAERQDEFNKELRKMFATIRVRQVVGALITQARGVKGPEDDPPF